MVLGTQSSFHSDNLFTPKLGIAVRLRHSQVSLSYTLLHCLYPLLSLLQTYSSYPLCVSLEKKERPHYGPETMKHIDGISIRLRQLDGTLVKEYENNVEGVPQLDFNGSLGTRQVGLREGTPIEVIVAIDTSFKLYSADGIRIEISSGSAIGDLSIGSSGQLWWLDGSHPSVSTEHKFSFSQSGKKTKRIAQLISST